ncbi:helix-turn-helix domain-containing protein [uncultured Shimia sp.]|uniref:helix-turn-helix domain-containing protein n=1 Tax=uncultured Shimia sp. TaxID=573152 RepID=UPI002637FEFE|nr:helix-turn-helix domain-containing protein [uncultured Shimia sp.]
MGKDLMSIREKRLALGWSQEQLATIAGLSPRTIQRIENGQTPGLETVKSLATAFETDVETLTRGKDMGLETTQTREMTKAHVKEIKGLHLHLWVFALVFPVLLMMNLFVTGGPMWVQWVLVFWLLGIVLHAVTVRVMHGSLRLPPE